MRNARTGPGAVRAYGATGPNRARPSPVRRDERRPALRLSCSRAGSRSLGRQVGRRAGASAEAGAGNRSRRPVGLRALATAPLDKESRWRGHSSLPPWRFRTAALAPLPVGAGASAHLPACCRPRFSDARPATTPLAHSPGDSTARCPVAGLTRRCWVTRYSRKILASGRSSPTRSGVLNTSFASRDSSTGRLNRSPSRR